MSAPRYYIVQTSLIRAVGFERAAILERVIEWTRQAEQKKWHPHDGRYWFDHLMHVWADEIMFCSLRTLKTHLTWLRDNGYIFTRYAPGFDRTLLYAANMEKINVAMQETSVKPDCAILAPSESAEVAPSDGAEVAPSAYIKQTPIETPKKRSPARSRTPAPTTPSDGSQLWESYALAFKRRYGHEPTRDAAKNTMCATIVKKVGLEAARRILDHYLAHNSAWYLSKAHDLRFALADLHKLETELRMGMRITQSDAKRLEREQHNEQVANVVRHHVDSFGLPPDPFAALEQSGGSPCLPASNSNKR